MAEYQKSWLYEAPRPKKFQLVVVAALFLGIAVGAALVGFWMIG
jgi:uncharacterized protein involved in exopolysaccharide biosynthesis